MREGRTAELDQSTPDQASSNTAKAYPAAVPEVIGAPSRRRAGLSERWQNFEFIVSSLVMRDFKVRYRNMSLGVLWSLANPLIMMAVLTFVFIHVFPNNSIKSYPIFFLSGLVPFNFFSIAWSAGTVSLQSNANLVKRVRLQKELIPISAVLAQSIHFVIQMALLLVLAVAVGLPVTRLWLWIFPIMAFELASVSGFALLCSALDVHLRDTRYVVDSLVTILFWLTPIFYPVSMIPDSYRLIYQLNPIASAVIGLRNVVLDGTRPTALASGLATAIVALVIGAGVFARLKGQFSDYI